MVQVSVGEYTVRHRGTKGMSSESLNHSLQLTNRYSKFSRIAMLA